MTSTKSTMNKIAEVTIFFWIIKIIATTLGEMSGDMLAQTLNLGYVVGLGITGAFLVTVLFFQIRAVSTLLSARMPKSPFGSRCCSQTVWGRHLAIFWSMS